MKFTILWDDWLTVVKLVKESQYLESHPYAYAPLHLNQPKAVCLCSLPWSGTPSSKLGSSFLSCLLHLFMRKSQIYSHPDKMSRECVVFFISLNLVPFLWVARKTKTRFRTVWLRTSSLPYDLNSFFKVNLMSPQFLIV